MAVDQGRDASAIWHPSDNFGDRRGVTRPDMVVLHYTAMSCAVAARDWLCNADAQVSAHYVISETGTIWQLVDESKRAWHAGAGAWGACTDLNSRSIGIEISNTGAQPFSEPQMAAVETLLARIMTRWSIPAQNVIAHSDLAVGRKIDPGPRFDWRRLAIQGLAIWPDSQAMSDQDFYTNAARFGYCWSDGQEDAVLNAFRMRFLPTQSGPLSARDRGVMAQLSASWPYRSDLSA